MSFNFSIREAKAFHRSLEAQVTVVEGSLSALRTGPATPEVPLPYGYRCADGFGRINLNDIIGQATAGVPSLVAPPWAEWDGVIAARRPPDSFSREMPLNRNPRLDTPTDMSMADYPAYASARRPTVEAYVPLAERRRDMVADEAVDRDAMITQGPISAWAERVARRQLADVRLPTATQSEAEAIATQMGRIPLDTETDPRMAPDRVYRPPVPPDRVFLDPQAVEQMRHENMRTMEELRAADRDYVRYSEEVTLSMVAREVRLTVQAPVVAHHLDVELRIPPTRTINAGVTIDPSDIP